MVDIDKMQYGFMPGRGTIDTVFVLKRLTEKFRAKKKLFFIFVDQEKAFDQVSREVTCFALRRKSDPEYLVNVSVDRKLSSSFSVKVAIHQGSALSPFLFIIVIDFLKDVRYGSLMELLYADDLVLCAEPLDEVMNKYG